MLIPRYSLRWLLGLTTFSALISLVLSYAVRGQAWAIGVAAGLWCVVIAGLLYVAAFLAAWCIAQFVTATRQNSKSGGASSFARQEPGESPFGLPAARLQQPAADSPPSMTG
jgi:hypothetical protein